MQLPPFGVEMIEGVPGSGKSYMMTRRAVRVAVRERRPVYTNLPLRLNAVRAFLKLRGARDCGKLFFSIDKPHFMRFLHRLDAYTTFARKHRAKCPRATQAEVEAAFCTLHGPHRHEGRADEVLDEEGVPESERPNWILRGSVIFLDEVHEWFDQRDQTKNEDPLLALYTRRLRHCLHQLVVASQHPMQVSLTFRRLCDVWWVVRNRGEDKVAWGVRFKHVGLMGLGYERWNRLQREEPGKYPEATPLEAFTVFPQLPNERVYFRLYNSFTHAGSLHLLLNEMEDVVRDLGVAPLVRAQRTRGTSHA